AGRAADALVRSGAFGLVVMDLAEGSVLPIPLQARLVKLAQRHETALVCLTRSGPGHGSLGPLVSLRAEAQRPRDGEDRSRCVLSKGACLGRGGRAGPARRRPPGKPPAASPQRSSRPV